MIITGQNIEKFYGKKQVLFGMNFNIDLEQSGVVGLIGPNGSGKSTMMRLIGGITSATAGCFSLVNSKEKIDFEHWTRYNTFYAPAGERGLRNKLNVIDNLKYFSALRGERYNQVFSNAQRYANLLNSTSLLHKEYGNLSTGQKKKAEIIVAVSLSTRLLLLDEPSTGLDINAQVDLMRLIQAISEVRGKNIIISSHDPGLLAKVVSKYLFIAEGNIVKVVDHRLSEEMLRSQYKLLYGG